MENLRITFLIFGIIAIVAILIHGLWTIRKNAKSNEKRKSESRNWQSKSDPLLDDDEQFDANGIGSVRVVSTSKTVTNASDEQDDTYSNSNDAEHDDDRLSAVHSGTAVSKHTGYQEDIDDIGPNFDTQRDVESESSMASEDIAGIDKKPKTDGTEARSLDDLALDDELTLERSEMDFAKLAEEHEQVVPKLYGSVVTQPKPGFQRTAKVNESPNRQSQNQDNTYIPEPPPFLLKSGAASPEVNPEANKIAEIEPQIQPEIIAEKNIDSRGRVEPEFKLDAIEPGAESAQPISLAAQARKLVSRRKKSVADVIRKEPALHASDKLNEEQMRIDFSNEAPSEYGEPSANKEPSQAALTTTQQSASTQSNSASTKASSAQPSEQPTDVLVINIRAPEDREISGAALLPMLLTLGLKFGEQDIFHRHVNTNGKGPVLFSLANLFKPGVFDIDNIETFSTRGLSLFMMLPIEGDAQQVFNMMHNAARKLAEEFSCQILDGGRGLLTKQGLQKYSERIREFERKRINR
ncbi:MAG: cell division protein ZipA [Glaciecola sp.]|jgi:cell division protein ZipA